MCSYLFVGPARLFHQFHANVPAKCLPLRPKCLPFVHFLNKSLVVHFLNDWGWSFRSLSEQKNVRFAILLNSQALWRSRCMCVRVE